MKVLLATIPSDSHSWNLVYMQLFIEEHGHKVINLGPCTPLDLLLSSVIKHQPDLIVVSTINGHANVEGLQIAQALSSVPQIEAIPAVIGGKLGTLGSANVQFVEQLQSAGFKAVFHGENSVDAFAGFMKALRLKMTTGSLCVA